MLFTQSFAFNIAGRVALLLLLFAGGAYAHIALQNLNKGWLWVLVAVGSVAISMSLYRYVNDTNRRLTRFLESVRYSDFAVRFSSGA